MAAVFFESESQFAIPDLGSVESTVTVTFPPGFTLTWITVSVAILHTYDGDLDISLIDPDGNIIDLSSDNGGGGDNYVLHALR